MPNRIYHIFRIALRSCLLLVLFGIVPGFFLAQGAEAATVGDITLAMGAGLDTTARVGYWTPVQVTIVNNGADFSGKLSLRTFSGAPRAVFLGNILSSQRFEQSITVSRGARQTVTVAMPFNVGVFNPRGVQADLIDASGRTVATQSERVYTLNAGDLLIGILSDQQAGLNPLASAQLPSTATSVITASLDATTLPDSETLLNNLDALIIENFDTKTLHPAQLAALQAWVNQGGVLIEVGGATGQRTLAGLPASLVPVSVQGVSSLPAGTHLLPDEQPAIADTLSSPVVVSTGQVQAVGALGVDASTKAVPLKQTIVLDGANTPLFIQQQVGSGSICYLAFDPMVDPLLSWAGTSALWTHLLLRSLGDQFLISSTAPHFTSGPGQLLARGGLFAMIQPAIGFSFSTLILLFLVYVLVLGPLTVVLIRRFKKPFWLWRIVVGVIVVFSLLSYGLAYYQRGAALLNNTISLIQLDQNGSAAHITTYMGIYIPDQGNYHIHIPTNTSDQPALAQALVNAQWFTDINETYGDPNASVNYDSHQTTVTINGAGQWTFHTLVMEHERQLQGGILTHLTLHKKQLIGSVTNTLLTGLSDVSILMPHSFVVVGHMNAGETKQIALPIEDFSAVGNTTQASQLALYNNLPADYFPYLQNQQPQTTTQLHMALLQALSGAGGAGYSFVPCGGPCVLSTVIHKQNIITPTVQVASFHPNNGTDPLLLPGVPATLLAWTEQPVDGSSDITINDTTPHGQHENLLQVSCSLALDASTQVLSDAITGHVVSTQGSSVTYVAPNVYSVGGGSGIIFEFTPADITATNPKAVQFTAISAMPQQSPKQQSGVSTLQAQLYNWPHKMWDSVSIDADHISVPQPQFYLGPYGRILLNLYNQGTSSSTLLLSKPSMTW